LLKLAGAQRQCHQAQISAANGSSARPYFSLKVHFAVLCRNSFIPIIPPGQPPNAPSSARVISGMRRPDLAALHLSKPNAVKEQRFIAENQMMQNRSNVFRRAKVYHEHLGFGAKNSWLCTLHPAFKLAASPGFAPAFARSYGGQARSSGSRDRRAPVPNAECEVRSAEWGMKQEAGLCLGFSTPHSALNNPHLKWSLGEVLPLRLLGVDQP